MRQKVLRLEIIRMNENIWSIGKQKICHEVMREECCEFFAARKFEFEHNNVFKAK